MLLSFPVERLELEVSRMEASRPRAESAQPSQEGSTRQGDGALPVAGELLDPERAECLADTPEDTSACDGVDGRQDAHQLS